MKHQPIHVPLRSPLALAWVLFVVLLTMLPGSVPLIKLFVALIGGTDFNEAIGHISLFGILTGLCYLAFARWLLRPRALLLALGLILAFGTATELYQTLVWERSATLADLLANWLGVFVAAFVVSYPALAVRQP